MFVSLKAAGSSSFNVELWFAAGGQCPNCQAELKASVQRSAKIPNRYSVSLVRPTPTRVKGQTRELTCISVTVSAVHSAVVMAICEGLTGRMNSETNIANISGNTKITTITILKSKSVSLSLFLFLHETFSAGSKYHLTLSQHTHFITKTNG